MVVVVAAFCFVVAQSGDDLGGGAPLAGPSAADLGGEEKPPPETPAAPPPTTTPAPAPPKKKKTTTTTEPAPAAPPPKPAAAPTTPAPSAEVAEKAKKLHADADALLLDLADEKKTLQRKLDAFLNNWIADNVLAAEPELKALVKLVKVRAAVVAGRFDDADVAVKEARAAADAATAALEGAPARRLSAAVRFAAATVVEGRARQDLFGAASCGSALGLKRLAADEARRRKHVVEEVAERYSAVARGADRLWGRRAAYQIAALYDDVARAGLGAASFRGLSLPAPYAVDVKDTSALLDPVLGQWFGEIRRSYAQLLSAIDARDPDPALAQKVRDKAAALAVVALPAAEAAENPWHKDLHEGVLRVARRPERRNAAGRFVPVESKVGIAELQAQLKKPVGSVDHAFALTGLAEIAPEKVSADDVKAALAFAEDDRVVVAGLIAAERVVSGKGGADKASALRDAVTAAYAASTSEKAEKKQKPFSTLQGALYGKTERALLALQAIARADRTSADAIVADERLPAVERAWIIAELLDGRFAARFDSWAWDKDERTAALAVWGGYQARGKNASYLLRPSADGLVGCVSKAAAPD